MRDGVAVGAQHRYEIGEQREGVAERVELGNLAADMRGAGGEPFDEGDEAWAAPGSY